jgi:hypothetical protein
METIGAVADSVTALIAVVAATIALLQLRRGRIDAKAARIAELSWNIYNAYEAERLRIGRYHLELIAGEAPVPETGTEFKAMYRSSPYTGPNQASIRRRAEIISSSNLKSILRYYQQIGILLNQGLIDEDFIFPLIGPGIETSTTAIKATVDYYQTFHSGTSGREAGPRRTLYKDAALLTELHSAWKARQP